MVTEKLFPDPQGDEFAIGAEEIQKRYSDFFDNHPLNTDNHKWDIHQHCVFGKTYTAAGGTITFFIDANCLPEQAAKDLHELYHRVYDKR